MQRSTRQQEILNVSIGIVGQKGIQALTIKNIAAEMHVSEPALYRHYKNKLSIMLDMIAYFGEQSNRVFQELNHIPQHLGKVEGFVMDRYRLFTARPDLAKILFSEEIFQYEPQLLEKHSAIMQQHRKKLMRYFLDAQQAQEIRTDITADQLFHIVIGSMRLLVTRWCRSGQLFDLETEGRALWQAIQTMMQ